MLINVVRHRSSIFGHAASERCPIHRVLLDFSKRSTWQSLDRMLAVDWRVSSDILVMNSDDTRLFGSNDEKLRRSAVNIIVGRQAGPTKPHAGWRAADRHDKSERLLASLRGPVGRRQFVGQHGCLKRDLPPSVVVISPN